MFAPVWLALCVFAMVAGQSFLTSEGLCSWPLCLGTSVTVSVGLAAKFAGVCAHGHEVLRMLFGGPRWGLCLGVAPASKVSMTIICPPQHGHGGGAADTASGSWPSTGSDASPRRSRANLTLAARLALASSP